MSRRGTRGARTGVDLVVPPRFRRDLTSHLAGSSADGREALAVLLCGQHRSGRSLRLLARHLVLPADDCFDLRSAGGVRCSRAFDDQVLALADREALTIITLHSHMHRGRPVFSSVDDSAEEARAMAIRGLLGDRVAMGSVVTDMDGEHWQCRYWQPSGSAMQAVGARLVRSPVDALGMPGGSSAARYDRQVRAFGSPLQAYLDRVRVGIVGVGGLGSQIVESLARMGVRHWVLVDPDVVEMTNLNRLSGAYSWDAEVGVPKVEVARRATQMIHEGRAEVQAMRASLPSPQAVRLLADCDVLISATDNHSSRFALQEIAVAYLRPLVNAGVGLVASDGVVQKINVRVTAPPLGGPWCLMCAGVVDVSAVARERCDPGHTAMLKARGYLADTPMPAVHWINGHAANLAVGSVHDLLMPFRGNAAELGADVFMDLYGHETIDIGHDARGFGCATCAPDGPGRLGIGDVYLSLTSADLDPLDTRNDQCEGRQTGKRRRRRVTAIPQASTAGGRRSGG